MICLWKQVYECKCGDVVDAGQRCKVARQGSRIAGDQDDTLRGEGDQTLHSEFSQSGAGRIGHHQVAGFVEALQELIDTAFGGFQRFFDTPGIGFERKADLWAVMKELA